MPAHLIDGKALATAILAQIKSEVGKLAYRPLFCDILVGADPVSLSFVKLKGLRAKAVGLDFKLVQLPDRITTEELTAQIAKLQQDPALSGLIIQLPLPKSVDQKKVLAAVDPSIDADGLSNRALVVPPTAAAIITILDSLNLDWAQRSILVIGQGELVGRPVTRLLRQRGLAVMTADSATKDLLSLSKQADIIISGAGQPGLIQGHMIKPGCVVIDAGTAELAGGIVGDVDTKSVLPIAGYLAPTPGGVGPLTVAKLLANVVRLAKLKSHA